MNEDEVITLLSRIPLFSGLDRRQLKNIAKMVTERDYQAGSDIVVQGEGGIGLFMVCEGRAEATRVFSDGSQAVVNTFEQGDFFGEMALLDDGTRTATVKALQPTRCLVISRWVFMGVLKNDTDLAIQIMKEMVKRFRAALEAS